MTTGRPQMDHVTSADGTAIAFESAGAGHPIILSAGIFNDRSRLAPLAEALAPDFAPVWYDRRARGASGDTRPYALDREGEDLAALIDRGGGAGGPVGHSSRGGLPPYAPPPPP